MRSRTALIVAASGAIWLAHPAASQSGTPPPAAAVPQEVRTALARMADAMRALNTFDLRADMTTEEVLDSGQKLQSAAQVTMTARRPDRFFIGLDSERRQRRIYYDGRDLTIYSPIRGYYATVAAPPTSRQVVDELADRLHVDTPLADLFDWGANGVKLDRIRSAMYAGPDRVGDTLCDHYAFRQDQVDWQLWIRREAPMLPCKLVITDMADPAQPQSTALLRWASGQPIADTTFRFVPPANAIRIDITDAALASKGSGQ